MHTLSRRLVSLLVLAAPAVSLAAIGISPSAVVAQSTATVRGIITASDKSAPLAGARIAVESPARVSIADATGAYVLRALPPGTYDVVITAVGYQPLHREVTVTAGQPISVDARLSPGSLLLSSVVTTATRTPLEARVVAGTVNVLTSQHIATSPSRESQDLLREIPAVELPRTSSLVGGTAQIVSIRGVDEGRTAVLFDGIPVNDAWGEWIDWGRVPKGMLDRVEVVEGGTSSLYGNGAMGGVISFFSRPMAPGAARMTLESGSRDTRHVFAAAGVPLVGALSANVSGDYQSGGGYTLLDAAKRGALDIPSEIIQRNAYVRLNYAPSPTLSAFVTGHAFGDTRALGTPFALQTRDQRNVDVGLDYRDLAAGTLALRAWDGRQDEHQRSTAIRAGARAFEDSSIVADIPSHDWGASAQWTRTGLFHLESVSIGGDYRHYNGNFDEVNFSTTCPGASCGAVTRRVLSGGDQALSGAFVQVIAAPVSPLRVELSARVDRWVNSNGTSVDAVAGTTRYPDSSKTAFSPRVGLRYQVHRTFALHAAGYRAFRAPNLAELYRKQVSASSITLPNPYLKAENAEGREAGFDWQPTGWAQLKGTWYVADYNDFNVPVTLTTNKPAACGTVTTCRTRLNVNKSRSEGGEAYLALRPVQSLLVSAAVNYDDARQQSGLTAATINNKPHINRVPSPKQTVRATWTSQLLGTYTAIWRHEGHTTTLQGAVLDPFTVVDAHVAREIYRGLGAYVAVENVGNTRYQVNLSGTGAAALLSYGMPRTFRLGVSLDRN